MAGGLHTTKLSIDPQSDLTTASLIATGDVTVSGDVSANGSITAAPLKSTGAPGLKVRSSADVDIVKCRESGTVEFCSNVNVGGSLSVIGSFKTKLWVGFYQSNGIVAANSQDTLHRVKYR